MSLVKVVGDDGYLWTEESVHLQSLDNEGHATVFHGEENEEYRTTWSSDYPTCTSELSGCINTSNPVVPAPDIFCVSATDKNRCRENDITRFPANGTLGSGSRFGPLSSFNYRYFMSTIRLLQLRVNFVLLGPTTVLPEMDAWAAHSIGRSVFDSWDAYCFLFEAQLNSGVVKNMERWLYQRDSEGHETFPDAKITQTPAAPSSRFWASAEKYDWIARAGSRIGFAVDDRFLFGAVGYQNLAATLKVCFHHGGKGGGPV